MMTKDDRLQQIGDRTPDERNLRVALGKRIRHFRMKKRWTKAELARRLGATRVNLARWEQGRLPPLHALIRLSEVLETSLDVLLAGRSTPEEEALTQDQKKQAAQHLNQLAGLFQLRARGAGK